MMVGVRLAFTGSASARTGQGKPSVGAEHCYGVDETTSPPGRIALGIPEIPDARHSVDGEESAESERDGGVCGLETAGRESSPLLPEQPFSQDVLRREQRPLGVARHAMNLEAGIVRVAVLD